MVNRFSWEQTVQCNRWVSWGWLLSSRSSTEEKRHLPALFLQRNSPSIYGSYAGSKSLRPLVLTLFTFVLNAYIYIYTFSISLMLSQHSVTTQEALWNDVKSRWENMSHPVLYKWGTSAWVCEGKHQILRYHEIHGFMTKTQRLTEIVKITLSSVMKEIRLHLKQISNIGPFIQSQNLNPTFTIFLFFVFLLYNKLIIWVLIRCSLTLLWLYKC